MLDFESEMDEESGSPRRLVNTVSLLLPAKVYTLSCSWTTERPLPAIEEFACRLILLFDGVTPFELSQYFGLASEEQDGLVESLVRKRLVEFSLDGRICPASVLRTKSRGVDGVPSLTNYETRDETAIFDLLTLELMPRRAYQGVKHGLPEIPAPENFNAITSDQIIEQFSRQYRAHLENTRSKVSEIQKTRLYKVGNCRQNRTVQIPIDMEISIENAQGEGIRVYRDAVERIGNVRKRSLSNDLEARIADYLGQLTLSAEGFSFGEFCEALGDEVLLRYSRSGDFDLSAWLRDRSEKKTGYGAPATRGLLGPVYLNNNRISVCNTVREILRRNPGRDANAYWYAADVPLWAANGTELSRFVGQFQKELSVGRDTPGQLVTLFNSRDRYEKNSLKRRFASRLPNAVSLWGSLLRDRVELLVIPGILGVAQYHVQPNHASAITGPVGHLTTDPERIARIEGLLTQRTAEAWKCETLWSAGQSDSLVDEDWLGIQDSRRNDQPPKTQPTIRWRGRNRRE